MRNTHRNPLQLNWEEPIVNINDYGIVPNTGNLPGIPARVTAVHKERYELVCEHGIICGRLKTKAIMWISRTFPQPWPVPRYQAIAANFDYVFIMQSLNMDFNPRRLERYLTLGWQS